MNKIEVGFGRKLITPPLGTPVSGYYEERYASGVLDDLYVNAVAFSDGEKKTLVISLEIVDLSVETSDAFRKLISEYCGLPTEAILLNCTHTHTGPEVDAVEEYKNFLGIQTRDAAATAIADLKPAKLSVATGKAEGISFVRRFRMKNGNVQTNPGVDNPEVDHALGVPNETVKLVKCEREGADDVYIVNFGVHADSVGGDMISGDYPGFVVSTVEKALDNVKCIFLTAPQGDVNHINPFPNAGDRCGLEYDTFDGVPRGYEHAKHMGRVIAGAVLQICGKTEYIENVKISYAKKETRLPAHQENDRLDEARKIYELHTSGRDDLIPFEKMELTTVVAEAKRIVVLENGPEFFEFSVGAISIGDIVFCAVPGEMFTEVGNEVCSKSSYKMTLVCCLSNGGETYFPTTKAYSEGGYEARSSRLAPGYDEILIRDTIELFDSIK